MLGMPLRQPPSSHHMDAAGRYREYAPVIEQEFMDGSLDFWMGPERSISLESMAMIRRNAALNQPYVKSWAGERRDDAEPYMIVTNPK